MSTDTATVETLTAEVRVLMVGNRQITQSVAKQLDTVKLSGIEPFGRVRIAGEEMVIGRRKDGADLVTAQIRIDEPNKIEWWASEIPEILGDEARINIPSRLVKYDRHDDGDATFSIDTQRGYVQCVLYEVPDPVYEGQNPDVGEGPVTVHLPTYPRDASGCPTGESIEHRFTVTPQSALDKMIKLAERRAQLHDEALARYREAKDLPLIVLAGLR